MTLNMNLNLADREFVRDPWATLETIRATGPVVYNPSIEGWMVVGYRDCARVMGNAASFTSEKLGVTYAGLFGGDTMQFDDTPRHDAIKAVWAAPMRRDNLASLA